MIHPCTKDRIVLHLRSHHNEDQSLEILEKWLEKVLPLKQYHNIIKEFYTCDSPCLMEGEESPVGWTEDKFSYIMKVRQESLTLARFYWADYFWSRTGVYKVPYNFVFFPTPIYFQIFIFFPNFRSPFLSSPFFTLYSSPQSLYTLPLFTT